MKYKFTPVAEDSQHLVDTYKSLFAHGFDESDEVVTVKDSLSIPNNGVLIKRAIEELIIAPRHLPSIRRTPYEIACDEFELTIETYK